MLALILSTALAQAESSVYIAPLTAGDAGVYSITNELTQALIDHLDQSGWDARAVQEMEAISGLPAEEYSLSCPAEEYVTCAFLVGQASKVKYAVATEIRSLESGYRVIITYLDVQNSEEVLSTNLDIASGGESAFTELVSRTLTSIDKGDISANEDIRVVQETGPRYDEEEAMAMDDYTRETGGGEAVEERVEVEVEEKKLTKSDIDSMMEYEGTKEWDRLDMSPRMYMKYVNSGMSLRRWRDLTNGRKGQVMLRVGAGVRRTLNKGYYHARRALSGDIENGFREFDAYAWQTPLNGVGLDMNLAASYGLAPFLDVGAYVGRTSGGYSIDVHKYVLSQNSTPRNIETVTDIGSVVHLGGTVLYTPLVIPRVRPVIGADVAYILGRQATDYIKFSAPDFNAQPEYPELPASNMTSVHGILGAEVSLSNRFDFYVHVPIGGIISVSCKPIEPQEGCAPTTYRNGSGYFNTSAEADSQEYIQQPMDYDKFSVGINLGVQIRIPVIRRTRNAVEEFDDM